MKRIYRTKSAAKSMFYLDDFPVPSTITVIEEYSDPVDTGLLDPDGRPIVSMEVKDPIGFIHWEEE